ncbi:hypothetical protein [Streptomyces sp. CRN 30]|uniref:hypothetical protein n=1 Tax=Streptomyces sp. CRN 30 TaxID=3075613 RepID=UPI002A80B1A2|nr:hypothetical protein [Streptomyces sp. CRN 30]
MIFLRTTTVTGSLVVASFSAAMILSSPAVADDDGPGSSQGGKAVDAAPAGVKLTTTLPSEISVDNGSEKTGFDATVKNGGSEDSGKIKLWVVGFDGMTVNSVEGCTPIAENNLPEGSNSGYNCELDNLPAGETKSYAVDATYDLSKKGEVCLPVLSTDGKKTFWQQGPVPFGTTNPSPDAPATPLLLGTDNQPVAPGGDQGDEEPGSGQGKDDELPRTGAGRDDVVPLGAAGAALVTAGAAGLWWTRRRPSHERG